MTTVCVDPDDFQTDGAGRLQIKTGCGIENSPDGIIAGVEEWPFDCDVSLGEDVYCNPLTGKLAVRPRHRLDCIDVSAYEEANSTLGSGDSRVLTAEATIDILDWCGTDQACAMLNIGGQWAVAPTDGTDWRIDVQESLDGAAFTTVFSAVAGSSNAAEPSLGHFYGPRMFNITPGAAVFSYRARLVITCVTGSVGVFNIGAKVVGTYQTYTG